MLVAEEIEQSVAGKRVTVVGAARSGAAVAELLLEKGARPFVTDAAAEEKLAAQVAGFRRLGISFETGGHTARALDADIVVLSPGVPSDAAIVADAVRRGLRVVSEIELASWYCPAPIVAVTGTNGKTTTTTLVGRILGDARRKHAVGGNIGTAFSSLLVDLDAASVAVLEVSSFQLDHIETFHPKVSVILNITPDHLDRYGHDFGRYAASKCRVFENQGPSDVLIYNADDEATRSRVEESARGRVRLLPFGLAPRGTDGAFVEDGALVTMVGGRKERVVATGEISIRGVHNLYNAMAAALAAGACGVGVPSLRATLRNFKGVEHRLEYVRELGGVKYVNDSKATNVDSVWYALQAFTEPLVVLIGGRDKGNDYTRLNDLVAKHVRAIVAIGESSARVVAAFSPIVGVATANSMDEAVAAARSLARPGDVVLLSPACASFDWFRNYEHRGQAFKEIVNNLV